MQRDQHEKQLSGAQDVLQTLCAQADEAAAKLRTQAEVAESAGVRAVTRGGERSTGSNTAAGRIDGNLSRDTHRRDQGDEAAGSGNANCRAIRVARTIDAGSASSAILWQERMEQGLRTAQEQAAEAVKQHAEEVRKQVEEEGAKQSGALRAVFGKPIAATGTISGAG